MAAAVEVLEAAKGFDLAGVAEAGHMSTAAADETVCKKPWADVQQAKTIEWLVKPQKNQLFFTILGLQGIYTDMQEQKPSASNRVYQN